MKHWLWMAAGLTLAAGSSSQTVNFDYDRRADVSTYGTCAWHEGENTLADEFPLAHQRFTGAVDRELETKGFHPVDTKPDVCTSIENCPPSGS